ncbi:glycoside hydrolase superfamily [Haematococcus lacustris]
MLRQDDLSPSGANASSGALDERFLKGVAISVWQSSGDEGTSNWSRFANFGRWPFGSIGVRTTWGKYKVGKSCDFWHRYREDMKLAKDIGCTAFRFSFEWARIEPERGRVDSAALDRYSEMLDCLAALGLEPCVTLHHFTHPLWFEDQGGFSQAANIPLFVEYCKVVFSTFGQRIRLWATFNEPTSHVFLAYVLGASPPGYLFNLLGEGRALGNMLRAHSAAYHALKAMPGGQQAQVGLVNHHITMVAHGGGPFRPLAKAIAPWAEYYMGWDVMDQWMRTGEFSWKLPLVGRCLHWQEPGGRPPCDWWGINVFSRTVLSGWLQPSHMPGEVMTDMSYPLSPETLYQAIKRSSAYGIPMYVTENGIADNKDDRRAAWIHGYFQQALRAVAEGYDVRGFFYYTLMDNFEWATGYTMKFGLFSWEPDGSKDRVLKEGAKALVRLYKTLPDSLPQLRKTLQAVQCPVDGPGEARTLPA